MDLYFTRVLPRPHSPLAGVNECAMLHGHSVITGRLGSIAIAPDGQRPYVFRPSGETAGEGYFAYTRERPRESAEWQVDDLNTSRIDNLRDGAGIEFMLRVTATKSIAGARVCITMDERKRLEAEYPGNAPRLLDVAQDVVPEWLVPRLAASGLLAAEDDMEVTDHRQYRRTKGAPFWGTDICGSGVVTDAALLRQHLLIGIGRCKSAGCGMLFIKPRR